MTDIVVNLKPMLFLAKIKKNHYLLFSVFVSYIFVIKNFNLRSV